MLPNEFFEELLVGGLDEQQTSVCRAWINASKQNYGVKRDLTAIRHFSDRVLMPRITGASLAYSSIALLNSDFIGLPTPRFQIRAIEREGHQLVAIHEGFLHLVSFLNEVSLLSFVLWEHLKHVPKDQATKLDLHLKLNKLRIARKFLKEPFRLPSFLSQFSEEMKWTMSCEIDGMMAFAMHHELAHHQFGHVPRTKTVQLHPLIEESLNYFKHQEFDADQHAIQAVKSNLDSYIVGQPGSFPISLFWSPCQCTLSLRTRSRSTGSITCRMLCLLRPPIKPEPLSENSLDKRLATFSHIGRMACL